MKKAENSQKAEIRIYSTQHDISEERVENIYTGEYRFLAGAHVITYEEFFQNEGNLPVKSTSLIKVGENYIHIAKKGAITTQMHFEPQKKYYGNYQTPFGSFDMAIDTEHVTSCWQEHEISAKLQYFLSLNNCPVSKYTVQIAIILGEISD